jgi:hypothetical protein
MTLEERLLAGIEFDTNGWGCWLWSGYATRGYGTLKFQGVKDRAHRWAWKAWRGAIPADRPHICHHCDTPACIRLDHLFAGTHAENMVDRLRKGRQVGTILQAADIPAIRARAAAAEMLITIAADYGVDPCTISDIVHQRTWRHIHSRGDTHMARRRRIEWFTTHLGVRVTIEMINDALFLVLNPPAKATTTMLPLDATDLEDFKLLIDTAIEKLAAEDASA